MNLKSLLIIHAAVAGCFITSTALATPSQYGPTGLVSVPTAETLDVGNLCVGIWSNLAPKGQKKSLVLPATVTAGIGSFWELYATYPNLLMDGEEDNSVRNSAEIGTKIRFYGKRSSSFKIAGDFRFQRQISENLDNDGTTAYGGRLIATYKTDTFGIHAFSGYKNRKLVDEEEIVSFGSGLEFSPTPRARVTAEIMGSRSGNFSGEGPLEGLIGLQYHLSPYLTVSLAGGSKIGTKGADWRVIMGLSTCTGLGAYFKPVPKLPSELKAEAEKLIPIKPVKIIPVSSKLVKAPAPVEPVSKIEVPVESDREEVVIRTYGQIILPPQVSDVSRPFVPPPIQEQPQKDDNNLLPDSSKNRLDSPPTYGVDVKRDSIEGSASTAQVVGEKLVAYRKFRFPDLVGYFQQGKTELTPESKKTLSDLAEQLRNDKTWSYLRVDAYTDAVGSQKYNTDLSLRRAIEVANYLINREGIDASRVFVRGMGSVKQMADNATDAGRKINRRFEILFLRHDDKQ